MPSYSLDVSEDLEVCGEALSMSQCRKSMEL